MNLSPSQKLNTFFEDLGLNINDFDDPKVSEVISFLQDQVDGVSKVKMAIEALLPIEDCLTDASDQDLKKFHLYKIWLMSHHILELDKLAQEYNIDFDTNLVCMAHESIQNPAIAEAAAMFQSKEWQKLLWGKWASPPYDNLIQMKLPNADNAIVNISKLRDYCLNKSHPRGKHKARVFEAALSLTAEDAEQLQEILLQVAKSGEAIPTDKNEYGQLYIIDFEASNNMEQQATIRSSWIVRNTENFPRLTSCYIL